MKERRRMISHGRDDVIENIMKCQRIKRVCMNDIVREDRDKGIPSKSK